MNTIEWNKKDCPFCGSDGKVWKWNIQGGQSYVNCNHKYDKSIFTIEANQLIKDIAKLETRQKEIQEILNLSKDEI